MTKLPIQSSTAAGLRGEFLVGGLILLAIACGILFFAPVADCPRCEDLLQRASGPFPGCEVCGGRYSIAPVKRWIEMDVK